MIKILISKNAIVKWNSKSKKHYEELGFIYTKRGDSFTVDIINLTDRCLSLIVIKCDYCGKEYDVPYGDYLRSLRNSHIKKDCCDNCKHLKIFETNQLLYGTKYPIQLEKFYSIVADKNRLSHDFVENEFKERDYMMISKYINSSSPIDFICLKHINKGIQDIVYSDFYSGCGCSYCGLKRKSGSNSPLWKGGTSNLNLRLREFIGIWKKESMANCNYKCVITGEKFDVIHHLYSFNKIVKETLIELKLPTFRTIGDYSDIEIKSIEDTLLKNHYKYPLGICLKYDIHKKFHSIYGTGDNTPEQWYEFVSNNLNKSEVK